MSKRLARFFDEVLEVCWRTSPTMATSVGIHDHDHRLVDCDPEAIADRLRGLEAYRRDLAKLLASTPRVSADGRLDARVLGNFLEVEAHLLDEVREIGRASCRERV